MIEQNTTDSSNIDNASIKGNNNKINISSIIEDNSGGLSSTRIMMIMWLTIPLLVWVAGAIVALYHGIYTYPSISPEVVTCMLGITGAKVCQRPFEKSDNS